MCYTEKAPNAWHAEEHKRQPQETPTINPIDRQQAQLADQAPGTIKRAAQASHDTNQHSSHERLQHINLLP